MSKLEKITYSDGRVEYKRTAFGDELMGDLAANAGLAGKILKSTTVLTGKGVSALKDRILTDEEKAQAALEEEPQKESAVMQALRSTGGLGATFADLNAITKKGDAELKQIGKSLLNRFKK